VLNLVFNKVIIKRKEKKENKLAGLMEENNSFFKTRRIAISYHFQNILPKNIGTKNKIKWREGGSLPKPSHEWLNLKLSQLIFNIILREGRK